MTELELIYCRHSVRKFRWKPLKLEAVATLNDEISKINRLTGLHIQLITDEPEAFKAEKKHYGQFQNCKDYIAMVGPKGDRFVLEKMEETVGYYGERLVLKAMSLGIDSCWVAMTYRKQKTKEEASVASDEKLYIVIALGYGVDSEKRNKAHKSKKISAVSSYRPGDPDWFRDGVEAALLAPTAMNQQRFWFARIGEKAEASAGLGFFTRIDLGIVKYHFEIGSGRGREVWV